jgi:hypothetical protein
LWRLERGRYKLDVWQDIRRLRLSLLEVLYREGHAIKVFPHAAGDEQRVLFWFECDGRFFKWCVRQDCIKWPVAPTPNGWPRAKFEKRPRFTPEETVEALALLHFVVDAAALAEAGREVKANA